MLSVILTGFSSSWVALTKLGHSAKVIVTSTARIIKMWDREQTEDLVSYSMNEADLCVSGITLSSKGILSLVFKAGTETDEIMKYLRSSSYSGFRKASTNQEQEIIISTPPIHQYQPGVLRRIFAHFGLAPNAADRAMLPQPLVGVVMGSDSDLETMKAAAEILEQFDIPVEVTIVSAHRTVERAHAYGESAYSRGIRVIVAGAGGAAHLPGTLAASTPLPIIGVPCVPISAVNKDGMDALLSIVQMPAGIPVNAQAIGGGKNGGLSALGILAASNPELYKKLLEYRETLKQEVLAKADKIEDTGWRDFSNKSLGEVSKPDAFVKLFDLKTAGADAATDLALTDQGLWKAPEPGFM